MLKFILDHPGYLEKKIKGDDPFMRELAANRLEEFNRIMNGN